MKGSYQIADVSDRKKLASFLANEGQALLPFVGLGEGAKLAIDELIDVMGHATLDGTMEDVAPELDWFIAEFGHRSKAVYRVGGGGCGCDASSL